MLIGLLVLLLFVFGMLSKPMLVTMPLVLLLLDYWPLNRLNSRGEIRKAIVEKLPRLINCPAVNGCRIVVPDEVMLLANCSRIKSAVIVTLDPLTDARF